MKLTLAKVLARKYQQVVLYLTLCPLCLLITFANRLDPDQTRKNDGPDLDPNCLTPGWYLIGMTIDAHFDYHNSITITETTITILSLSWHTIMILSRYYQVFSTMILNG